MNIDNRINNPMFAPAPLAGSQPRQDNDKLERVAPAEPADAFAGQDERRERGGEEIALYDARGQKTSAENDAAEQSANSKEKAEDEQPTEEAASRPSKPSGEPMTEEEVLELNDLKLRDQEVRTHEQQHAAVGGQHAGAPNYEYETGPDGKQYAVEGSVQIDISPVPGDPQATIEKMQQVKAAAMAPAEPSQADKNAAAQAEQMIAQARAELSDGKQEDGTAAANGTANEEQTSPAARDPNSPMQQRNEVIAGVYGRSAKQQAQALIGLA